MRSCLAVPMPCMCVYVPPAEARCCRSTSVDRWIRRWNSGKACPPCSSVDRITKVCVAVLQVAHDVNRLRSDDRWLVLRHGFSSKARLHAGRCDNAGQTLTVWITMLQGSVYGRVVRCQVLNLYTQLWAHTIWAHTNKFLESFLPHCLDNYIKARVSTSRVSARPSTWPVLTDNGNRSPVNSGR